MRAARLIAAAFLFLGAYCPEAAHALAHAVNSAHVHEHDDGTVHAHEHDARDHHAPEPHCVDDAPRLVDAGAKFAAAPLVERFLNSIKTVAVPFPPRLVARAALDPPQSSPQCLSAPSAAGRAPPA